MEQSKHEREVWMRGPIPGIHPLLQPVAHALLQVQEDIENLLIAKHQEILWIKPFGQASIAFHVLHIAGVINRMFSYAFDKTLTEDQFNYLHAETQIDSELTIKKLKENLRNEIDAAITSLQNLGPDSLTEPRFLGRQRIPTTQISLLFHAAEHAQRHFGQLLVTLKTLENLDNKSLK